MESKERPSIKQSIIITIVIIVIIAGLVAAMVALGIEIWIVFMGLTVWTAFGTSLKFMDIVKVWASAFVGLLIGYMLGNMETLGTVAIVVVVVGLLLLIYGMVSQRMGLIFNSYTAIFITAGTATGIIIEPVQAVKSLVFGFLVIGVLPYLFKTLTAKKKA